jgi:uncharacterized protein YrrD
MDLGDPISYEVLPQGTPVYSSDGEQIGTVAHVLADESQDIFDGIVVAEHFGRNGHRFADSEDVDRIYQQGVVLKLDRAAAEDLPEPTANPAVMHDDPAESDAEFRHSKLRRAWDLISGNY